MLFAFLRRMLKGRDARAGLAEGESRRAIRLLVVYLVAIVALHIAAMMAFEGMPVGDAAWLTMTTITTVGYGDISASTAAGRVSTVVLVYLGGIFALAKGAGDYFDYRTQRRLRMLRGHWRWDLQDHVLLINAPRAGAEPYFATLVRQFRATDWGRDRSVLILSEAWPEGLPTSLQQLGVVQIQGRGDSEDGLAAADAKHAAALIVLAEDIDPRMDAIAFDTVHRLRAMDPAGAILAECADDRNRARLRAAGATTVLRPMRGYPEMMVRAVVAPGSEYIIEDLFTAHGDECVRYEVAVSGIEWGRLASALIMRGVGTPIAYAGAADDAIEVNPKADRKIDAAALFVIVKEGEAPEPGEVRRLAAEV